MSTNEQNSSFRLDDETLLTFLFSVRGVEKRSLEKDFDELKFLVDKLALLTLRSVHLCLNQHSTEFLLVDQSTRRKRNKLSSRKNHVLLFSLPRIFYDLVIANEIIKKSAHLDIGLLDFKRRKSKSTIKSI